MVPILQQEFYLAKMAGAYDNPTPAPVTANDHYLSKIAGDYNGPMPKPITRRQLYLAKIAEAYTGTLPEPITRIEKYWYAIANGTGQVPYPVTREEKFLYEIIQNLDPEYVDKIAQGNLIVLMDSTQAPLNSLNIFGKSTQNGTPSPENPVPIVNVGDSGEITVSITGGGAEQSFSYPTPNGLPGIPVSSGGNYTDENGQHWVCDEVDFERGVYVKRIKNSVFNGSEDWKLHSINSRGIANFVLSPFMSANPREVPKCLSNMFVSQISFIADTATEGIYPNGDSLFVRIQQKKASTVDEFKQLIQIENLNLVTGMVYYEEYPIAVAELSAYAALHTNYPTTTIISDTGVWMEVGYKGRGRTDVKP